MHAPSEPDGGESIPVVDNSTYACPQLNLSDVEIGDEVPLDSAPIVVAGEPQAGTVVDALAQKPYEVVARAHPQGVSVVEEESVRLAVLWVWIEEGVWLAKNGRG